MATFREFCGTVKKGFQKFGAQVEKTADVASLRIKLTGIDGKLNEYYTELGRLTYAKTSAAAGEDVDKEIESVVAKISGKMAEKKETEAELEKVRASMSGEKTEYEAEAEQPSGEEQPSDAEETAETAAPCDNKELPDTTEDGTRS